MTKSGKSSSSEGNGVVPQRRDTGRHTRFTTEQLIVFERVYAESPKPSLTRRKEMITEYPILANIDPTQIKVWFQNRRCRDKLRKECSQIQLENKELNMKNMVLTEENNGLQNQVSHLLLENKKMQQHLEIVCGAIADPSFEATPNPLQHSSRMAYNHAGLLLVAEETRREFILKATGTAIDWVPIPGLKPGADSIGVVSISHMYAGVAARACSIANLEPMKIADILKNRQSWFQDCRKQDVFARFPAGNGGLVELVYMQFYAPTTQAIGRDFWTLRYTSILEDGSLVVCEQSLSGTGASPKPSVDSQFIRAKMLASGFLIRSCEGGGSIIHIVDHLDLEALCVPELLQPLYESSRLVAQKMTVAALRHVGQVAKDSNVSDALIKDPAVLRSFKQRLRRGFNDAVNGFSEDGWSMMCRDIAEDLILCVNSTKNINTISSPSAVSFSGGILCVKASRVLQNVPPTLLIRFLREHRSKWADFNIDARTAASLKAGSVALQGVPSTKYSHSTLLLGDIANDEEMLEIIHLEGQVSQKDAFLFQNIYLLQVSTGLEENTIGACSELVFAPVDEMLPDDSLLLCSGFRILELDSKTKPFVMNPDTCSTSSHTSGSNDVSSVFVMALQFPFESHHQESVMAMARKYVRNVFSVVDEFCKGIAPPRLNPPLLHHHHHHVQVNSTSDTPDIATLAIWICQSYSAYVGVDLLLANYQVGGSVLAQLWRHQCAIICCSVKANPAFVFANQNALTMLETTVPALQDLRLDQIFDISTLGTLYSYIPLIMHQNYAILSGGNCISLMGHRIGYEQVVAWKVLADSDSLLYLGMIFINWSFM